ncbi:MAG: NAD(P)/FAD-dependent oxidoreductase [Cyclobacteriaceae bacterium]|nr:NAD(P)/FAD-dependent oxidoreductase [Cyclobacteriaceae bacterium HetDA_MAG_MS6]
MEIVIIGGGASGFFTAINIAEKLPTAQITIIEKSNKILSKVKISGGGRCNVTNNRNNPGDLVPYYPRGGKKLYPLFKRFSTGDMRQWLTSRGVRTKSEEDQRVFPVSNNSQSIIDCFERLRKQYGIGLITGCSMNKLQKVDNHWHIETNIRTLKADLVVIATGSSEKVWKTLSDLNLKISPGVPSLFTFNIEDDRLVDLAGISFPETKVKIASTKLAESGPLLFTHWGLSGPAILKLSAWGARQLQSLTYKFTIIVNFVPRLDHINELLKEIPANKQISNIKIPGIPSRYWDRLLAFSTVNPTTKISELPKKSINKLNEELTQAHFKVTGKSTFKEEFVTCGGVALNEINLQTMQCKNLEGLFMTGEVLDIDAITGGFNFQACWTTAWIVSESISQKNKKTGNDK